MTSDLQNLKDIIGKANPSLIDVELAVMKALDDLCVSFLSSRMVRGQLVIPSIMKAAQVFSDLKEGMWPTSTFVYKVTLKNLNNIQFALLKAWPQLDQEQLIQSVKLGVQKWVGNVIEENK